ncbi:hypothetical protein BY996DRAFT_4575498 [Phakopsora pachyrhizi]|nr:hypothetical protein BY996DRAFT_4575498 [Phakopsora pachyrhizi]
MSLSNQSEEHGDAHHYGIATKGDPKAKESPQTSDASPWRSMFDHLEKIQRLQSDIATSHQELEKVNLDVDGHFEQNKQGENVEEPTTLPPSQSRPDGSNRATPTAKRSEFQRSDDLRAKFLERQKGFSHLMSELSKLSGALNEIHELGKPKDKELEVPKSPKLSHQHSL